MVSLKKAMKQILGNRKILESYVSSGWKALEGRYNEPANLGEIVRKGGTICVLLFAVF